METLKLKALAKFLRELVPADQFNMSVWLRSSTGNDGARPREAKKLLHECGTSACALGWATQIFPPEVDDFSWTAYGERVFDLKVHTYAWKRMFGPLNRGGPAEAADRIEEVINAQA